MTDDYGRELEAIANRLSAVSATSVRGNGSGRFVFSDQGARAVELSRNGDSWWVEFFEGEDVTHDETLSSSDDATKVALDWLSNAKQ